MKMLLLLCLLISAVVTSSDVIPVEKIDYTKIKQLQVTATCYHAVAAQCNADYWHTADMSLIDTIHPEKHRWIAISRNLERKYGFKLGDTVRVEGTWVYDGIWIIHDRMNARWRDRIDFLVGKDMYIDKWRKIKLTKYESNNRI